MNIHYAWIYFNGMRRAARAIILSDDSMLVMHRNKFGQEYDILVGGGIEMGEEPQAALLREIEEETGVKVSNPELVFIEQAPEPYGIQYVYVCRYEDGEAKLSPESTEAKINTLGKNLYHPVWRKLSELDQLELRSPQLKKALAGAFVNGFPDQPIDITDL